MDSLFWFKTGLIFLSRIHLWKPLQDITRNNDVTNQAKYENKKTPPYINFQQKHQIS